MTEDVFPLQHRILSIAMEVCPKGNKVVQLLAVIFVMKKYISFILPLTHQRWPILGRILYIKSIRSVGSTFLHAFSASMLRGSQGKWSPSLHRRFVRIDGWLFLARCTMWKSNFCPEKHGLFLTSSIRKLEKVQEQNLRILLVYSYSVKSWKFESPPDELWSHGVHFPNWATLSFQIQTF